MTVVSRERLTPSITTQVNRLRCRALKRSLDALPAPAGGFGFASHEETHGQEQKADRMAANVAGLLGSCSGRFALPYNGGGLLESGSGEN